MSSHRSRPVAPVRTAVGLVLGLLLAALAPLVAHAAPPATATRVVLGVPGTPSVVVPATPGAPASYIVRGVDFTVAFSLTDDLGNPLPLSHNKDVEVALTVLSGPEQGRTWTTTVPSGATAGSFTGRFATAGNAAVLRATSQARRPADRIQSDATAPFDVLKTSGGLSPDDALAGIGGGGAAGTACDATPEEQVCGDLLLAPGMATGPGLGSLGTCDEADVCRGQSVQVLIPLAVSRTSPATLVMKCDKSACPGGAIPSYTLKVTLVPSEPALLADPCPSKGVVGESQMFCVDYVQSTRSNAGDTYLYLLFVEDAKVRFP